MMEFPEQFSLSEIRQSLRQMASEAKANIEDLSLSPNDSMGYTIALYYWQQQMEYATKQLELIGTEEVAESPGVDRLEVRRIIQEKEQSNG